MSQRSAFPPVFWVANTIEVLERFSYYGIYFGLGIYMTSLGISTEKLGAAQFALLTMSYAIPVISGSFADRFGFKKVLIVSYLVYLPAILLLLKLKTFGGILTAMVCIGFAAGIFKPLIAGTVRVTTDGTNKTLGFGIFYAMVNIGGSFGPIVAGYLRAVSWDFAFKASAAAIAVMFVFTILFYKEPPREASAATVGDTLRGILHTLGDRKFLLFLVLLGFFFWIPFWGFFNLCALYVENNVDTVALYGTVDGALGWIPGIGPWVVRVLSHEQDGVRRVLGESISHTGWIIIVLQLPVSFFFEKRRAMPSFMLGLAVAAAGLATIGFAARHGASLVFLGILLFAVGEMISSPRIQEYITWIAPKEKAGLYMGSNFLGTMIGAALSGPIYTTWIYSAFNRAGAPQWTWYVLGGHMLVSVVVFWLFVRFAGEFKEMTH